MDFGGASPENSQDAEVSPVMPELCAKVLSTSNTDDEMAEKRRLYFEEGAVEVGTCDLKGRLRFYGTEGERPTSN